MRQMAETREPFGSPIWHQRGDLASLGGGHHAIFASVQQGERGFEAAEVRLQPVQIPIGHQRQRGIDMGGMAEQPRIIIPLARIDGRTGLAQNAVHRAVVLAEGDTLTADLFPQIAAQLPGYDLSSRQNGRELEEMTWVPPIEYDPVDEPVPAMIGFEHPPIRGQKDPEGALNAIAANGEVRPLAEVEEELIRFALSFYDGQMSEVARRLGIGRSTLYRKLKDYAIDPGKPLKTAA